MDIKLLSSCIWCNSQELMMQRWWEWKLGGRWNTTCLCHLSIINLILLLPGFTFCDGFMSTFEILWRCSRLILLATLPRCWVCARNGIWCARQMWARSRDVAVCGRTRTRERSAGFSHAWHQSSSTHDENAADFLISCLVMQSRFHALQVAELDMQIIVSNLILSKDFRTILYWEHFEPISLKLCKTFENSVF